MREHIDALEREGKQLVSVARSSDLDLPVPSCPGWRLRDLVAHIGFVHRWAARYVSDALTEMVPEPDEQQLLGSSPPAAELVGWAEEAHEGLVAALRSAPADLRCWTFLPAPSPLAFWARRQAHETAVHRADAQLAARTGVGPFEPAFAKDGVDELLFSLMGRRKREAGAGGPWDGSLVLVATDIDASWTLRVAGKQLEAVAGDQGGEASVTATASQLYLLLWNRLGDEELAVTGPRDLLKHWRDRFSVKWS